MLSSSTRATIATLLLFVCAYWSAAEGHLVIAAFAAAGALVFGVRAFVRGLRRASAVIDGARSLLTESTSHERSCESVHS